MFNRPPRPIKLAFVVNLADTGSPSILSSDLDLEIYDDKHSYGNVTQISVELFIEVSKVEW